MLHMCVCVLYLQNCINIQMQEPYSTLNYGKLLNGTGYQQSLSSRTFPFTCQHAINLSKSKRYYVDSHI